MKHTPGPWEIVEFNDGDIWKLEVIHSQPNPDEDGEPEDFIDTVAYVETEYGDEEIPKANARLIAEAPAMASLLVRLTGDPVNFTDCQREAATILARIDGHAEE